MHTGSDHALEVIVHTGSDQCILEVIMHTGSDHAYWK